MLDLLQLLLLNFNNTITGMYTFIRYFCLWITTIHLNVLLLLYILFSLTPPFKIPEHATETKFILELRSSIKYQWTLPYT